MKKIISSFLLLIVSLPFTVLAQTPVNAQIKRVENGLLPTNVYDSLGEAYMANGEKELAIQNYKKSLELNPKNTRGAEMLKKLATN